VLSEQAASSLYDYFKQLFAQVTNPPIDRIREEIVTSLPTLSSGPKRNLLDPNAVTAADAIGARSSRSSTNEELAKIRHVAATGPVQVRHDARPLPRQPRRRGPRAGDGRALPPGRRCTIDAGINILILSDRGVDREQRRHPVAARRLPACTTTSIREGMRTQRRPGARDRRGRARCTTSRC
jgi:glutamate synthase (NADPH/NADH) large chain